jgi:hypothetical protein
MDERYIQELYNQLGGKSKFGEYKDFSNLITTNKDYQQAFHKEVGESVLGNFNDFSTLVKKKDGTQGTTPTAKPSQDGAATQKPTPTQSPLGVPTFNDLVLGGNKPQQEQIQPATMQGIDKFNEDTKRMLGGQGIGMQTNEQIAPKIKEKFDQKGALAIQEERGIIHKENKIKGIKKTAEKRIIAKGGNPNDEDVLNSEVEDVKNSINKGVLKYNEETKTYQRDAGIIEGFLRGLNKNVLNTSYGITKGINAALGGDNTEKEKQQAAELDAADRDPYGSFAHSFNIFKTDEDKRLLEIAKKTKGDELNYEGLIPSAGGLVGDIAMFSPVNKIGAGLDILTAGQKAAKVGTALGIAYTKNYGAKSNELFQQLKNEGYSDEEAAHKASIDATAQAIPHTMFEAALFGGAIPHAKPAKDFMDAIGKMAKRTAGFSAANAPVQLGDEAIKAMQGYDTDGWEGRVKSAIFNGMGMVALMEGLPIITSLPKYAQSAMKEYANSPTIRPLVDKMLDSDLAKGSLWDIEGIRKRLDDYKAATDPLRGIVPDDKMASIGGLQEKRNNIQAVIDGVTEKIKALEIDKKAAPALAKSFDEKIATIQKFVGDKQSEIDAIDKKIKTFDKVDNPLEHEVDDETGEPINKDLSKSPYSIADENGKLQKVSQEDFTKAMEDKSLDGKQWHIDKEGDEIILKNAVENFGGKYDENTNTATNGDTKTQGEEIKAEKPTIEVVEGVGEGNEPIASKEGSPATTEPIEATQPTKVSKEVADHIAGLNDTETYTAYVDSVNEIPEQFRDRAKKLDGEITTRKSFLGIPYGKENVINRYRYEFTGKEAKEEFNRQQGIENKTATQPTAKVKVEEPNVSETEKVVTNPSGSEEPPLPKGDPIVTPNGLTESERQVLIEKRKKSTAITEQEKIENGLVALTKKLNAKGTLPTDKRNINSKISQLVRKLNAEAGYEKYRYNNDGVVGKSTTVRKGSIKGTTRFKPLSEVNRDANNGSIKEDTVVFTERPKNVRDTYDNLLDADQLQHLHVLDASGKKAMSKEQIKSAIDDIENGIPSVGADTLLNTIEQATKDGNLPVIESGFKIAIPLEDVLNIKNEVSGEPFDEKNLMSWLNDESHSLTLEHQQILDNELNNIIYEYEQGGIETEIPKSKPTTETTSSKVAEPKVSDATTNEKAQPTEPKVETPIVEKSEPIADKERTIGKYEKLAMEYAKKIDKVELPSWAKIDDANTNKQGGDYDSFKKALSKSVIEMGKLLDEGVEFAKAAKEAISHLLEINPKADKKEVEDWFSNHYKENIDDKTPPINSSGDSSGVKSEKVTIDGVHIELPPFQNRHSDIDRVRNNFGFEEIESEHISLLQQKKNAEDTIREWQEKGIYDAEVKKVVDKSLEASIDINEQNILAQHIANLDYALKSGEIDRFSKDYDKLSMNLDEATRALRKARSDAARQLGSQNLFIAQQSGMIPTSVVEVEQQMREANKVDVLTDEQKKDAERIWENFKDFHKEEEVSKELFNDIIKLATQDYLEQAKEQAKKTNTPAKSKKTKEDYKTERVSIKQSIKDKLRESRGKANDVVNASIDFLKLAPDVFKLIRSYVEEASDITLDKVKEYLKKDLEEATEEKIADEEINKLVAGEYFKKGNKQSDVNKKLYELRQEQKYLNDYELLQQGIDPKTKKKATEIEKNQALRELRERNERLYKELELGKYSDEAKNEAAQKSAQKSIDDLQEKIDNNELEIEKAEKLNETAKTKELREKRDDLRKEIEQKRKDAKVGKYSDEAKFESSANAKIKANEKAIAEYERRLKEGDFIPNVPIKSIFENSKLRKENQELFNKFQESEARKDQLALDYYKAMTKNEQEGKHKYNKALDKVGGIANTTIATLQGTQAMFDRSLFYVQNLPMVLSHPFRTAAAERFFWRDSFKKKIFDTQMKILHRSEFWKELEDVGLAIYEPTSSKTELQNEIHGGEANLWSKTKVGQAIERGNASFQNNIRLTAYLEATSQLRNGENAIPYESNPKLYKDIARVVNEMTGHGEVLDGIKNSKSTSEFINRIIWSTKMYASTLNLLGFGDIIRPKGMMEEIGKSLGLKVKQTDAARGFYSSLSPEGRKFAMQQVGRALITGSSILIGAYMYKVLNKKTDDELNVEFDPRSPNFGNITINGENSISVFGRFSSTLGAIAQVGSGQKISTKTGKTNYLGQGFADKTSGQVAFQSLFRGKMTPSAGLAYDYLLNNGKNSFTGERMTAANTAENAILPFSVRDMAYDIKNNNAIVATSKTLAKLYGFNIKSKSQFESQSKEVKAQEKLYKQEHPEKFKSSSKSKSQPIRNE